MTNGNINHKNPFQIIDRAVLYARVSKDDRDNDARNLEGQIDLGREYATRQGYAIIKEIREDERGASGASFDLDGINEFFDLAENKKFDVLVVREVDRLARNRTKQAVIKEQLKQHGVRVEYVLQQFDDDPFGRFSENMMADFAELERDMITLRMVRGRRNKVKAGNILTTRTRAPFGYKVVETDGQKQFAIDENVAHFVKLIFDWYTNDGLTLRAIADKLAAMEAPLPTGGIKKNTMGWLGSTVSKILNNETYTGTWYYGKYNSRKREMNPREKWIAVPVPAIISPAQFKAAQERKTLNKIRAKRNRKHNYLLSGMCICGDCGLRLSGFSGGRNNKHLYYVCNSKTNREVKPRNCSLPYIRADQLEPVIWEWVATKIIDEKKLKEGLEDYQKEQEDNNKPLFERLAAIDRLLTNNHSKYERLLDLYLTGDFDRDTLTKRKAEIEKQTSALNTEKAEFISQVKGKGLTTEQITEILEFATQIREEVADIEATNDFAYKRKFLELLNMEVTVKVDGEERTALAQCKLGKFNTPIVSTTSSDCLQKFYVP